MSRKPSRRPRPALPPPGLRAKLPAEDRAAISLAMNSTLDALAAGGAPLQMLWDFAGNAFTWSLVAERLGRGIPETTDQQLLAVRLLERWRASGEVRLQPDEYELARTGVLVADALLEVVDAATAGQAALESETILAGLRATPTS